MNFIILIAAVLITVSFNRLSAQKNQDTCISKDTVKGAIYNIYDQTYVTYEALGICRIVKSDFKIIKNVRVKSVSPSFITYEKDGSLHDMLIEKIARIETSYGYYIDGYNQSIRKKFNIYFDKELRPYLKPEDSF